MTDTDAEARLAQMETLFFEVFSASILAMAVLDRAGAFQRVNTALETLLGHDAATLLGRTPADIALLTDQPQAQRLLAGALSQDLRQTTVHEHYQRGDGASVQLMLAAVPLPAGPDPMGVLLLVQDVADRRAVELRMRHVALHDPLTQLSGRALLLERLDAATSGRRRSQGQVAVMFADLDDFKLVNDGLGHLAGDVVLRQVASRLRSAVRPQDVVGRLGGDEFLVICQDIDEDQSAAVASRIGHLLAEPVAFGDAEIPVSASVGVALGQPGTRSAHHLLAEADSAMYRAKQLGKNRFEIFDHTMREQIELRARIRALLSRSDANERVVVHYQPIVDLRTREAVGFEALMRFRDDDGTLLAPDSFINIAEEHRLLAPLGTTLLREAATQVQQWRTERDADLGLSVNVSGEQLSGAFAATVTDVLLSSGLPAQRLMLELTEQVLIAHGAEATSVINELHGHGVRFALDDFGTGWASLTYLRRYPISLINIDRSFVAGLPDQQEDLVIVATLVQMGKALDLECTAEGVESEAQYAALRTLSPPYAQGWLFGRPMPADLVPAMLDSIGVASRDWPSGPDDEEPPR